MSRKFIYSLLGSVIALVVSVLAIYYFLHSFSSSADDGGGGGGLALAGILIIFGPALAVIGIATLMGIAALGWVLGRRFALFIDPKNKGPEEVQIEQKKANYGNQALYGGIASVILGGGFIGYIVIVLTITEGTIAVKSGDSNQRTKAIVGMILAIAFLVLPFVGISFLGYVSSLSQALHDNLLSLRLIF